MRGGMDRRGRSAGFVNGCHRVGMRDDVDDCPKNLGAGGGGGG